MNTVVRCVACGQTYDRQIKTQCPICNCIIAEDVLITIKANTDIPIVDFKAMINDLSRLYGIKFNKN